MDAEKLKNRIREAIGAAGIGGEISAHIGRIIDEEVGQQQPAAQGRAAQPDRQRDRHYNSSDEDEHADRAREKASRSSISPEPARTGKAAETRRRSAVKTAPRRKK